MNYVAPLFSNKISRLIKTVLVVSVLALFGFAITNKAEMQKTAADQKSADEANLAALEAQQWMLKEIDGEPALAKSSNHDIVLLGNPFIKFNFTDQTFGGNSSCNFTFGKVEINGNKIKLFVNGITMMLCAKEAMRQERDFHEFLKQVTRFELQGQTLNLYAGERLVLKFAGTPKDSSGQNQKPNDIKLETYKWVQGRGYITFDQATGQMHGYDGCDGYRGNYETEGDKIGITIKSKRDHICVTAGGPSESLVKSANRFEIKDGKLNLFQDDKLLLTLEAKEKSPK